MSEEEEEQQRNTSDLVNCFYVHMYRSEYPIVYKLEARVADGIYLGVYRSIGGEELSEDIPSKMYFRVLSTGDEDIDLYIRFMNPENLYLYWPQAVNYIKQYVEWKMKESGQTVS